MGGGAAEAAPAPAWDSLAHIFNEVEKRGEWPAALAGAKIVFLSKGQGNLVAAQWPMDSMPMLCV